MEARKLDINPDAPGFIYKYKTCTKKFLGICTKHEIVKDTYDMTDPVVRKMLFDKGFVLEVREKVTP